MARGLQKRRRMARALWNGSIAFGLVQIPIGLYGAEERDDVHFTQLDKNDLSPIGYERVNKKTGKKVAWSDIVKGYEFEKGEYVVFSDAELAQANVEASQSIDISVFVDKSEIDPMFIERPLFVVPSKQGQKAYQLLREVLEKTGRAGIAQVVLRTRQSLAALVPHEDVLVLLLLRYSHELRSPKEIDYPASKAIHPSAAERKMAEQLVDGMTDSFEPEKFKDTYVDDVHELAKKKVKEGRGSEILHPKAPAKKGGAKVIDLAALLQQSLAGAKGKGSKKTKTTMSRKTSSARPHHKKSA
ncbi:MAG: Ku protein [Polyangiaceae bacterium]